MADFESPSTHPEPSADAPTVGDGVDNWKRDIGDTERNRWRETIYSTLRALPDWRNVLNDAELRTKSDEFENSQFEKAKTYECYVDKISRRMERVTAKSTATTSLPPVKRKKPVSPSITTLFGPPRVGPAPCPDRSGSNQTHAVAPAVFEWEVPADLKVATQTRRLYRPDDDKQLLYARHSLRGPSCVTGRPPRSLTHTERNTPFHPLGVIAFTKQTPSRPVLLGLISPAPNDFTLIIAILSDGPVRQADRVVFDVDGSDCVEKGVALIGQLTVVEDEKLHPCVLHPYLMGTVW